MQGAVHRRPHTYNRSRKTRTPQRRASGTEKPLCRQGDTQGVAPGLLTCPHGFAVCRCPDSACKMPCSPTFLISGPPGSGVQSRADVAAIVLSLGRGLGALRCGPRALTGANPGKENTMVQMAVDAAGF